MEPPILCSTFPEPPSSSSSQSSLHPSAANLEAIEKLNTIGSYSAEYRRANMMKRTQRVAIINEDEYESHNLGIDVRKPVDINHDLVVSFCSISPTSENVNVTTNLEEILSDPEFPTFESYV